MSIKYFPLSDLDHICHHVYDNGGCTFCGFCGLYMMKRFVSSTPVSIDKVIQHFDKFVSNEKNYRAILQDGRISIEAPGSWFVEVPKALRQHIYRFIESHNLELRVQNRATLISEEKTRKALSIMMEAKYGPNFDRGLLENMVQETLEAFNTELKPYMLVSTGLEIAVNSDLKLVNKGCQLDDFISFSEFVRSRGAKFGASVLIGPPLVQNPIRKALKTVQFAFETLKAEEVEISCCAPRIKSCGHESWRQGKWNPVSATEGYEICKIIEEIYPLKKVKFDPMRVYFFHGKYSGPKIKTKAQKAAARENVRKIAKEVFSE